MPSKVKKPKLPLTIKPFTLRWYPNSNGPDKLKKTLRPHQMPPLMVRKPEWRK